MKITIIGASAGVGLSTTKRAIERGHQVTTLSRSEISLPKTDNLKMQIGNALRKEDLLQSIASADAVIIALGTGKNMKATTLYSDFAKLLVEVQKQTKTSIPFIILTGFGAGESKNYLNGFFMRMFFKFLLNKVYADKTLMEEIISKSDINWEIVRPGLLKDKPLTEKYRVENKLFKGMKIGSINREDVADFMVKQVENPTELKKYPALSNL